MNPDDILIGGTYKIQCEDLDYLYNNNVFGDELEFTGICIRKHETVGHFRTIYGIYEIAYKYVVEEVT